MHIRVRVIEMAARLFNEQGIVADSTNHIAGALSMSPGSLYEHFRNNDRSG